MENTPNQIMPSPKKPLGAVVAIVIIVVLIALGGLYFWGKQLVTNTSAPTQNSSLPTSSSDEVQSIANDATINLDAPASVDVSELDAILKQ